MRTILVLLGASFSGYVMGQTTVTDGWVKDISNVSAVTALILALGYLLKIYIPSRDAAFTVAFDKMADRYERWEKTRHEDSETLNSTLLVMTKNCAEAQAVMRAEGLLNKKPEV